MASLEIFQTVIILLAVLLLLLGSSLKLKEKFEIGGKREAASMLALSIANKLDSFQRNACGGGFCYTAFTVPKHSDAITFLPNGVLISDGEINATALTAFPIASLNLTLEDYGAESRIVARGYG